MVTDTEDTEFLSVFRLYESRFYSRLTVGANAISVLIQLSKPVGQPDTRLSVNKRYEISLPSPLSNMDLKPEAARR